MNLRQLKIQPKRIIAKIGIMVFITWDIEIEVPKVWSVECLKLWYAFGDQF